MANEIANSLFAKLAEKGVRLDDALMRSLPEHYLRRAQAAVDQFHAVASINGLKFCRHAEEQAVETFYQSLVRSQRDLIVRSSAPSTLGSWMRVGAALPDFGQYFRDAVAADQPALTAVPTSQSAITGTMKERVAAR